MAGIGFLLRKLAAQDNFSGILRAYFHSAVVAAGPWILVVISISFITTLTTQILGYREVDEFLSVIIYNFFFSFTLSAPLYLVSARYVADCLYARVLFPIPGIMVTSSALLLIPLLPLAILFYLFFATMAPFTTILSIINFALLIEVWIMMLYLTALRDFRAITLSWTFGIFLASILSVFWGKTYGTPGLLLGLNLGIAFILYSLKAQVLAEYPYPFRLPKEFRFYFANYKKLFWSGFFLFAGLWIDKVIMWAAPQSIMHLNHLRTNPLYDGAMFISYLSIIPGLALFIFSLETNFYDSYIRYVQHIDRNAPLSLIEEERKNIFAKILENGRSFCVLQGAFTLGLILLASSMFSWIGIDFQQLDIFRLGVLGAFFGALNLCIVICFSYFDSQNDMLFMTAFLFFSNVILTLLSLQFGFAFYGWGYCFSMVLTFLVGALRLLHFIRNLHYNIFISNIIKRRSFTEPPLLFLEELKKTHSSSG